MNSTANHQLRTPALAALAIATCVHGAFAQSPRFRALAASGDTATGVTGTAWYRAFTSGFVNEAGTTAFAADIDGIALPDEVTGGVWLGEVESFDQVGLFGVRSFASGVTIRSISNILGIVSDRDVFVSAQASYISTGEALLRLSQNDLAPWTHPDRSFGVYNPYSTLGWGPLIEGHFGPGGVFIAEAVGTPYGLYGRVFASMTSRHQFQVPIVSGRQAPMLPAEYRLANPFSADIGPDGTFIVGTDFTTPSFLSRSVIYRGRDGLIDQVVLRGDQPVFIGSIPLFPTHLWRVALGTSGNIAFISGLIAASDYTGLTALITLSNTGAVGEPLLLPVAFWDGRQTRSSHAFMGDLVIGPNGTVVFTGWVEDDGLPLSVPALLRFGESADCIAAERGSVPDDPQGTITRLQTAAAAPNGDIAWTGAISTPNLGIGEALYLAPADGSPQRRLLASGDPVPGPNGITRAAATIRLLGNAGPDRLIARGGLTTSGFALVRVGFADGTQSLLLVDTLCPADVDRSRTVDLADLFAFFDAYDRRDWPADITADGSIDLADFFAFFEGFDTGCE